MSSPIGLMERFALADDREAFLTELIPGSDEYFFYHCLHYQNLSQLDRAEAILNEWSAARKGRLSSLMRSMTDRQRLLTYDGQPDQTIRYLVDRLGINTSHASPGRKGTRRFESVLRDELISADRLVVSSLKSNQRLSPFGMQLAADMYLAGQTPAGISLKDFLKRVDGAYLSRLDQLVVNELRSRPSREQRFGDLSAHRYLTMEELDVVAGAIPSVQDDRDYVFTRLRMLRPNEDQSLTQQPKVRLEYLKRVETYAATLPASYNSLKASAAYRLLESNLAFGIWDRDLLMRYLQLPRQSPIVHPVLRRQNNRASLTEDFQDAATLPPIGNEQSLIETCLSHFLRDAADTRAFDRLVDPDYLRRVFATTKLLSGAANSKVFYDMLSPPERIELRDRVQLTFAPSNPKFLSADQPTELLVDVKNIDKLVVRVYEMNSLAYYRSNEKLLDTDVELDGLIATHEKTLTFDRPAIERHRERIAIDQAQGRGVWVIDLVGKGLRTRAIIRRGDLESVQTRTGEGLGFTIIDEQGDPVPGAKLYAGNLEFEANDKGEILVPMVNQALTRVGIISDGAIAKRFLFIQPGESYKLDAAFFIDQTLVQSGRQSTLLVRPRLTLDDTPVDPSMISEAKLRVTATDLDGIQVSQTFSNVALGQDQELSIDFRTPPRTSKLDFELSGHVVGLSDRREREVIASKSIDLAGIRQSNQTTDAFLTHDGKQYIIETRGRSGELVAATTVQLRFEMILGDVVPNATLQSDDDGRIGLGELNGVHAVQFVVSGGATHRIELANDQQTWPTSIHVAASETLQLPVVNHDRAESFRLIELRADQIGSDHSERLRLADGFLVSDELPSGDYALIDRASARRTLVSVVDGPNLSGVLAGKTRHRESNFVAPVTVKSTQFNPDGSLTIQLGGEVRYARVHLVGSRYLDSTLPIHSLDLGMPKLQGRELMLDRNGYISDLRLGDEYEYVLRRQYAQKYPGVMLPQPGVLLNPWETETVNVGSQVAAAGQAPMSSDASAAPRSKSAMREQLARRAGSTGSDFDFLKDSGAIIAGAVADEDGRVTIPAEVIEGMPVLRIVAAGPLSIVQKTIFRKGGTIEALDLRLAKTLSIKKPYTFDRGVILVGPEKPIDLSTLGSAQVQIFGDVESLFALFQTLVNDPRFAEFSVLRQWGKLNTEQKLAEYSKLACHELHLFLWAHDRAFFDAVILPYLANKKEKQFIDLWLLGDSLESYTQLWRYKQLSAAERALLAIALPKMRPVVQRDLSDFVASVDRDFNRQRKLIESAIASGGMMGGVMAESRELPSPYYLMDEDVEAESLGVAMGDMFSLGQDAQKESVRSRAERASRSSGRLGTPMRVLGGRGRGGFGGGGGGGLSFYQELDQTKQWAESHFDRVRAVGGQSPQLIPTNAFWRDLAMTPWDRDQQQSPSVSEALLQSVETRHAALVALAFCGLPLDSGEIALPARPETVYQPEHEVALVTKRLMSLETSEEPSPVLIGQMFRPANVNANEVADGDPPQFETGQSYVGVVVLSNPTAKEQTVELFWQVPAGSIQLAGSQTLDSTTMTLAPFAVESVEYQFYFPSSGEFQHYPATVSYEGVLLARGSEKSFRVVEQLDDPGVTWQAIAREGNAQTIGEFLSDANLHKIDWNLVLHRLRDRDVYAVVAEAISQAQLPIDSVWAYGFHHKDATGMKHFLSLRNDFVGSVGPILRSPLLGVDSIEQMSYEHLEYAPFVRARIHRLGKENVILNDKFLAQYQAFVRAIGFQPRVENQDRLPLAYYLLLQNRIEESIAAFEKINREEIPSALQYDYMKGYLLMHLGEYEEALAIAQRYESYPIDRWQSRFTTMANQVQQRFELMNAGQLASVQGGEQDDDGRSVSPDAADLALADREKANSQGSAAIPEVIARVEDDTIRLDHRNSDEMQVNFYGVDLELLFSKAPFARTDLQRIAMVKPTQTNIVTAEEKTGTTRLLIPEGLRSKTLLVEAITGASRSTTLYFGGDLTTYVSEAYGQLQTTSTQTRRPVAGAYVKVYARYGDGNVRFYKDGYTDGRGRFDYQSVSASDAAGAERYAILVLSDKFGATLHEVASPQR
ncbi:MAG: tetratricopeptide repeat protein [Planctomycetota bacterium]